MLSTLAPSFLMGSSSFLQVTRTTIKSRMSSKFGQIRPRTVELAALERLKNRCKCCDHSIIIFDRIFFMFAGNEVNHNISDKFEIRPADTKDCQHSSPIIFDGIFFIFAGNEDNHKVSDEFEIPPEINHGLWS